MNFLSIGFSLISHIGLLLHTEKDIQGVAEAIFKAHSEKFPNVDEAKALCKDASDLLDAFGAEFGLGQEAKDSINKVLNSVLNLVSGSPEVAPPPSIAPAAPVPPEPPAAA